MERGIDVFKLPAGSSVFNNTWQLIKPISVSLHYFMKPVLQLRIKCLQIRREAG